MSIFTGSVQMSRCSFTYSIINSRNHSRHHHPDAAVRTGQPDRPLKIHISPAGRIRQPGSGFCRTNHMDYHPLHLPQIDHVGKLVRSTLKRVFSNKYKSIVNAAISLHLIHPFQNRRSLCARCATFRCKRTAYAVYYTCSACPLHRRNSIFAYFIRIGIA